MRVFFDENRVSGLQKFNLKAEASEAVPLVEMKFPFLRLWKEDIPKGDGYVTITYEDFISECKNFMINRMIVIKYGDTPIGMISKLELSAEVSEDTHTLVLEYQKDVIEMDCASNLREMLYKLPDWVNVVIRKE
jgi:hypothetical protein